MSHGSKMQVQECRARDLVEPGTRRRNRRCKTWQIDAREEDYEEKRAPQNKPSSIVAPQNKPGSLFHTPMCSESTHLRFELRPPGVAFY